MRLAKTIDQAALPVLNQKISPMWSDSHRSQISCVLSTSPHSEPAGAQIRCFGASIQGLNVRRLLAALIATVSSVALTQVALAADIPMKAPVYKAPVAAPAFSWTGFYAGVHAGGGVLFDAGAQQGLADRHGSGALAGGQLGYNYQTGMLVVGVEAEGFWSGIGNTVDQFTGNTWFSTAHVKNKADFDVAARFGIALNRALVYGKAGWAWGRFNWDYVDRFNTSQNASATLNGLLIGLGLEYAIAPNWTTKFEYDYLGFNAKNVLFTTSNPSTYIQNVSADKHIFKLGINYLFDGGKAPATDAASAYASTWEAAPIYNWTGFYAGVHAGGGVLFDAGAQQGINDRHGSGALAGGQLGYNYQTGMLVVGVEAEGFWSGIGNTVDQFTGNTWWSTAHVKNKADFDVAGRFGVALNRALVYGKAGWAWGHFNWDYVDRFNTSQNASATLNGLLIGLGLEYAIAPNWTTKFEYDYLGFNAKNVLFTTSVASTYIQNVSADKHIFKLGLNYQFDRTKGPAAASAYASASIPAPAYYWTGLYVGVHGGGGVLFDAGAQQALTDRHGSGALAGGQLGYNYQTGMLVVGIEAEGFWSGIGNTVDQFIGTNLWSTAHVKNKADFDIAARFGVASGRALVYGKAGWVWGHFTWDFATRNNYTENASATLDGLLIGLGLEYGIANNWTTKFEYDYLGFNAKNVLFTTSNPFTYTQNVSADKHIFKLGLNYQFGRGN